MPSELREVRTSIPNKLVEEVAPSLAVAVAKDGEIIWEQGFGWADRERHVPSTEHTMYSLASISKPITATGLMVLAERGKLDLDRPIDDYLGSAKINGRAWDAAGATVRRVANHTAGLPLHYHFFPEDEPFRRPAMDETIRRYANLVTVPGERYHYSNLGYGLLDYVIARLSGKPYADFMRQEVFLPLGLTRTSVDVGPGLEPYQAVRYGRDGLPLPYYDFDHPGGSAVFASAHDLVRFGMFHLKEHPADQKAILTDATLDIMHTPTVSTRESAGYGIGWAIDENDMGYRSISHDGGMSGVVTALKLIPSERLVVTVLANASNPLPHAVAREILSALLPDYAARRAQREPEQEALREPGEGQPGSFQPPADLRGEWSGAISTYKGDLPLRLWAKESGDVQAQLGDQLKTLVNDPQLKDGRLTGKLLGDVGTEDANRKPYHLQLDLKQRGDVLNGAVVAMSLPSVRLGNGLSHWAELRKTG